MIDVINVHFTNICQIGALCYVGDALLKECLSRQWGNGGCAQFSNYKLQHCLSDRVSQNRQYLVRDEENQLWKIIMSATDEDTLNLADNINKRTIENQQKNELHVHSEIDCGRNDGMDQETTDETNISVRPKRTHNHLLHCINRVCRRTPIIILSATILFITVVVLGIVVGVKRASELQITSLCSCGSINRTTSSTTIGNVHLHSRS
jgi:hypothetical protein